MLSPETVPALLLALTLAGLLLVFHRALGSLVRLLCRTLAGLAALWALAPAGAWLGVSLGVNLFNALVLGALGVPGLGLLLLLHWTLR